MPARDAGRARHGTGLAALVHGYRVAFLADAAMMLVAALAALALPATTTSRPRQSLMGRTTVRSA